MWLFTKEAAIGITRTAMAYVWAWGLTALAGWDWLMSQSFGEAVLGWVNGLDTTAVVLIGGTAFYGLVRQLAEKFPQVGYFLIFNTRPDYSEAIGVGEPEPTDPPT